MKKNGGFDFFLILLDSVPYFLLRTAFIITGVSCFATSKLGSFDFRDNRTNFTLIYQKMLLGQRNEMNLPNPTYRAVIIFSRLAWKLKFVKSAIFP